MSFVPSIRHFENITIPARMPLPRIRSLVQQQLSEGGVSSLAREVQRGVAIGILDVDFGASLEITNDIQSVHVHTLHGTRTQHINIYICSHIYNYYMHYTKDDAY